MTAEWRNALTAHVAQYILADSAWQHEAENLKPIEVLELLCREFSLDAADYLFKELAGVAPIDWGAIAGELSSRCSRALGVH